MPTKPEHRHHYGKRWRTKTRPRILKRAGGTFSKKTGKYTGNARCEYCGAVDWTKIVYLHNFPNHYFALDPQLSLIDPSEPKAYCFTREGKPAPQWDTHPETFDPPSVKGFIERSTLNRRVRELRSNKRKATTAAARAEIDECIEALLLKPIMVRVQIGIAHLNNKPGDDRDDNLMALCRYCHLRHDTQHHHETRSKRKDAGRPLLAAGAIAV